MKISQREAQQLIEKVITNIERAYSIAIGEKKGSVSELEAYVSMANQLCGQLVDRFIETRDADTENQKWLDREVELDLRDLISPLNSMSKYLKGEIPGDLSIVPSTLRECDQKAIDIQLDFFSD